eukprot:g25421.t1
MLRNLRNVIAAGISTLHHNQLLKRLMDRVGGPQAGRGEGRAHNVGRESVGEALVGTGLHLLPASPQPFISFRIENLSVSLNLLRVPASAICW